MATGKNKAKYFKSIELFAGAGGLAIGLEKAGFDHIGLVEFNKAAAETLKINRPDWNVLCEDVAKVAQRDLTRNLKSSETNLICYPVVHLVKVSVMQEKGSDLRMFVEQCSITMQRSCINCNPRCSSLKT